MRVLIIDPVDFPYGPRTPYERPLGGMQSAVVYLAHAIGKAGHTVVVLNNIEQPQSDGPVFFYPLPKDGDAFTTLCQKLQADVGVVVGSSDALQAAHHNIPDLAWMFWTGHAHDQLHHQSFRDSAKGLAGVRYMFVSEWQQSHFVREFALPEEACVAIGYGIAPTFEPLLDQPLSWAERPHLTYSSTPFRGLSVLTDILESPIGSRFDATIFSGMQTYHRDNSGFEELFGRLHALPHVSVPGAVSQTELAAGLAKGSVWAYSNTFAETFCIAAREAVAAGNLVIATALGALPETIGPLAFTMIDNAPVEALRDAFTRELTTLEHQWSTNRQPLIDHAMAQRAWLKAHGTWDAQAATFLRYVSGWLRSRARSAT